VFIGSGCAVPLQLDAALSRNALRFNDVELMQHLSLGTVDYITDENAAHLRLNSEFGMAK
jgi:hypothetical protein